MTMQRGIYHALLTVLCASALSGVLMGAVSAQTRAAVIDDAIIIVDAASCAHAHGTWHAADARCTLTRLEVRATMLTVPPTITLVVNETFSNGGFDFAALRPDILIVNVLTGTTEISGMLV
ncbi:MAG: hypothetical protein KDE20_27755, partial [Caldilineaceae bacterium]|nr:hypothetical protein [Caldilineaceae bacterium]